ncbi:MAG: DUF4113 domain-containing protein [Planctomycetes bacterium]|nr:DUF4113 domain-containing protein [Planctomycetota bacterium]
MKSGLKKPQYGASCTSICGKGVVKPWKTKFNYRSDRYMTNWDELVEVG